MPEAETDLQALERFVAENDDLLDLEERIGKFNIFDALGIVRREINHSNFLGWLLDPSESHGQGDLFLKAILMDLLKRADPAKRPLSPIELDGETLGDVEVRREWRNIDLLIASKSPDFVLAIENKVDSGEHSGQLQRYEDIVATEWPDRRRMFVFLTVEGDEASDEDWVSYSYADIHRVLDRVRRTSGSSIGGDVLTFLDHYLNLLGSRFMDDAKLDELCRRIYQNHRRAIDLITERIGSREREIVNHMASIVETDSQAYRVFWRSKDAVGFIPAIWLDALPAIARANSRDKRVWFSLYFGLRQSHGRLAVYFSIWITPTTNDRSRTKLVEALVDQSERLQLLPRPRSRPPYRNTPVHEELVVTFDDVDSVDLDLLAERVRQTMRSTTDRVSSIATILRALAREDPNRDDA